MKKLKLIIIGIVSLSIILCIGVTTVAVQKSQAQGQKKVFYKFPTTPEQENNRKMLTPEERKEFDEKFKQIEQRYREYIKRPLLKAEAEQVKNWSDADKIKSDQAKLINDMEKTDYLDNTIDTRKELLEDIESSMGVLTDMLSSGSCFNENIKEQKEEKERSVELVKELENFKKEVDASDDSKIMDLIEKYENTLRYKKIRY